jgi:hypothetical protein
MAVGVHQGKSVAVDEQDRAPASGPVPLEELRYVSKGVEKQLGEAPFVT